MKKTIFIFFLCFLEIFSYNPEKAIAYANQYCDKRNSNYNDYSNQFGDSPNFVSQCLIAGEEDLSGCTVDERGCVIDTGNLENCLLSKGWQYVQSDVVPDIFPAGGIIIDNRYAMFAITPNTYCAHSNDKCGSQIYSGTHKYYWK